MRNIRSATSLTRFVFVRGSFVVPLLPLLVAATTCLVASACFAGPTAEELVTLGKATQQRLAAGDAARWKAVHDAGRGVVIEVDILAIGDKRRVDFTGIAGGEREQLAQIIQRDGLWYVTEGDARAKYYPYEAPLKLAALYLYLARSELAMVTDTKIGKLATEEGDVLKFVVPLSPEVKKVLQQAVAEMKKLPVTDPAEGRKLAIRLAKAERQLRDGTIIKIDARHGLLIQTGEDEKRVQITNFTWVEQPPKTEFAVDQDIWPDETAPLAPVGSPDLAMIGYSAGWRPGQPAMDTDAMLVNLSTGKFRRVATPFSAPMGGCFSPDRTKVYVSAYDSASGAIVLGETDLAEHTFRILGGNSAVGVNLFPCVSPSGKSMLWLHKSGDETSSLLSRVGLLDVRTGSSKFIGEPMDTAFVSWLPDASAMILVQRDASGSRDKPPRTSIARMSSGGKVTILRPGNSPQVIRAAKRILFEDQEGLWKTCALDGSDEQLIGEGLKGFGSPSVSPDGTQLLMNKFDKATGPRPHIVDIKTGSASELKLPAGLWVKPIWQ
jgi:hypothetical protein